MYSKEFFKLQLNFAKLVSDKFDLEIDEVLEKYTSIRLRLFGKIEDEQKVQKDWQKTVGLFSRDEKRALECVYEIFKKTGLLIPKEI